MENQDQPITVCAWCKRIQDESGNYCRQATDLENMTASHGICGDCMADVLEQLDEEETN